MKAILQFLVLAACVVSQAAVYTVSVATDAGPGSMRQAIIDANTNAGLDTIRFTGPFSIALITALPVITSPVKIDGPFTTGPQIVLNGNANNVVGSGLQIAATAAGSSIRGLVIHGHSAQGILISASQVTVSGCYIGTNQAGTADLGNTLSGIEVAGGLTNITIGGSTPDSSNVISGNNQTGIIIAANSSTIRIAGNKIGLDVSGNVAIPNEQSGINLANANTGVVIGGVLPGEANFIGSNRAIGITINAGNTIAILGNNIGVGADGFTARSNFSHGIYLNQCTNVLIGGSYAAKNVISSNRGNGIEINNSNTILIQFNYIGTSRSGMLALGNTAHGIQLSGTNTGLVIGGRRRVTGNIISANNLAGINFLDPGNGRANSHGTVVKGNFIGTDSSANQNFGNGLIGIILKSDNCIIGDTLNEEGNVIGGARLFCGLLIANGNNNVVRGNFIGVSLNGTTAVPNVQDGINISVENAGQTASNNIIEYNTIAYNDRHGVNVGTALNSFASTAETGNVVRFNKIYCNKSQGIFINRGSSTAGNGGNQAPGISGVLSTSSVLVGVANTAWANERIDVYLVVDCPNCDINPQGKMWLDSVIADANGAWSFNYTAKFGTIIPGGLVVTATDASNNTSEFSLCCKATSGTTLLASANPVCEGSSFYITYSNGQTGDSLMLQRSLDGITWINDRRLLLTDPATVAGIQLTDTTFFRFVAFSNGSFPVAQCTDTSVNLKVNYVLSPNAGTAQMLSNDTVCLGGTFSISAAPTYGSLQWQQAVNGGGFASITGATNATLQYTPTTSQNTVQFRLLASQAPCGVDTSNVLTGKMLELNLGNVVGNDFVCDKIQYDLTLTGYSGVIQWQDSMPGMPWTAIGTNAAQLSYTTSSPTTTDFIRVIISDSTGICSPIVSSAITIISDTCSKALPVEIANALTPNGDGSNDVFYIRNIERYPASRLLIYNRWGNKVFEGTGYANDWDGGALPEATYYYLLELGLDVNGNEAPESKFEGTITLIKK
ncbi:MAG: gliding motility-associated C-terminal domain-containing protein [Cytophagaceae bacterium]|jgi:gliding motility-associated-like protein|nr:gliding motility-associated C-terminal domain-containing protein [Cytophagaceae bacterium]